jgi:hypothetical protein
MGSAAKPCGTLKSQEQIVTNEGSWDQDADTNLTRVDSLLFTLHS